MAYEWDESAAREMYKMLRHDGLFTVVHCQDVENRRFVGRRVVANETEFIQAAREFNGRGNVFCSRNPTDAQGNCARVQCVSFDIDPIAYDRREGATNEQIESCLGAGHAILEAYPGGSLIASGNGALVLYVAPGDITTPVGSFKDLYEEFTKQHIQPLVAKIAGVKLDALYDDERLIKVAGTLSCRGKRRLVRWVLQRSQQSEAIFNDITNSVPPTHAVRDVINPGLIAPGNRNKFLVSLAGSLRSRGCGEAAIYAAVKAAYEERCEKTPPYTEADFRKLARDILIYAPAQAYTGSGSRLASNGDNFDNSGNSISVTRTDDSSLAAYERVLETRAQWREPELTTGFKQLDELTDGYIRGEITTLGANTGAGKSSWFVNSANALCKAGKKVLYLSTELSRWAIYDKFFSLNTGIEYRKLRKGWLDDQEKEKLRAFKKEFADYKLIINDELSPSIEQVRQIVKTERPDVLIFDHLHQVGAGAENLYGMLSRFTNDLKRLAGDFNLAVGAAAQFSRPERLRDESGNLKVHKPTLYDFKACGEIENRSAVALLMHDTRESVDLGTNLMEMSVAKSRHGEKGEIRFGWKWKQSKFEEI